MSLTVLVIIVVAGIALVVVSVHLTGGTADATITHRDQALSRFAVDFEEESVRDVVITENARTAFLTTESGAVGIVQGFGDRFLTRLLHRREVDRAVRLSRNDIELRMNDFTWAGGIFSFRNASDADAVLQMFGDEVDKEPA